MTEFRRAVFLLSGSGRQETRIAGTPTGPIGWYGEATRLEKIQCAPTHKLQNTKKAPTRAQMSTRATGSRRAHTRRHHRSQCAPCARLQPHRRGGGISDRLSGLRLTPDRPPLSRFARPMRASLCRRQRRRPAAQNCPRHSEYHNNGGNLTVRQHPGKLRHCRCSRRGSVAALRAPRSTTCSSDVGSLCWTTAFR